MADAGRAMMLYRGMYDSTYTYEKLDVVNHNGSLYISTTDGNLGTEPTEETKWKLFLQGGVSDNIQATDTYGLVGTKGDSSFVQLLLDSLASRVQGVALNRQTLGYSKKNLYDNIGNFVSNSYGGVTISRGENDTFNAIGTATDSLNVVQKTFSLPVGKYIISKKISGGVVIAFYNRTKNKFIIYDASTTGTEFEITDENDILDIRLQAMPGKVYDITGQAIMIRSAEITDGTYEPYVDDVDTRLQKIDDSILNTLEEIDANTSEENIAGALAIKSLKSNFANSIEAKANLIRNSFAGVSVVEYDLADILNSTEISFAMLVSTRGYVATDDGGSLYFISGMTASQYVQVVKICGDDIYSPQISVAGGKLIIQAFDINGCNFSILKLIN